MNHSVHEMQSQGMCLSPLEPRNTIKAVGLTEYQPALSSFFLSRNQKNECCRHPHPTPAPSFLRKHFRDLQNFLKCGARVWHSPLNRHQHPV